MHLTVGLDGNDAVEESRAKICPGSRIGGYLAVGLPDTVIRKIPRISLIVNEVGSVLLQSYPVTIIQSLPHP